MMRPHLLVMEVELGLVLAVVGSVVVVAAVVVVGQVAAGHAGHVVAVGHVGHAGHVFGPAPHSGLTSISVFAFSSQ